MIPTGNVMCVIDKNQRNPNGGRARSWLAPLALRIGLVTSLMAQSNKIACKWPWLTCSMD